MKSSDSVKTYLNEIRSVPLLTKEEEISLAKYLEECRSAIVHKLLDAGMLGDEIRELRRVLAEAEMDKAGTTEGSAEVLPDDDVDSQDVLNILDDIIELGKSDVDRELLASRVLEADMLTGIIEKTVEKIRIDSETGKGDSSGILSSIEEIENRMQEAKDSFIRANLRLSADIARKYSRNDTQLMDLIQEGNIGLMRAVDKFDYRKGYRFSTYAVWWIRQYIMRSALLSVTSLNVPAHILLKIRKVIRTSFRFIQETGREPTIEELSERLNIPVEKTKGLMDMMHKEVSLEAPAGEDGDASLSDFVADDEQPSPADDIIGDELMKELNEALSILSPREEKVIRMKFGIGESKRYSMEEIGKQLGISRERVSQIEVKAMRKLRHPRAFKGLKIFLDK
ncbi:MAG: sigma-70 family RNA polymerase sigma factor [Nitrospirae bacterium]|nr:sigma-70 family RNA polymerase sigma factor [Nitrospirota bacterium]